MTGEPEAPVEVARFRPDELDGASRERLASGGGLERCLACEHPELYTQKDFPRAVGILVVVVAALFAPFTHYLSLVVAAALDWLLYRFAPNVVVCYTCRAEHRGFPREPRHPSFDLEIEERLLDPADELHRLALAIVRELRRDVEASGARFRMLILPAQQELKAFGEQGSGYWTPLVRTLIAEGVELLDLSEALHARGFAERDADWMPGGHYGPELNAQVAGSIRTHWALD